MEIDNQAFEYRHFGRNVGFFGDCDNHGQCAVRFTTTSCIFYTQLCKFIFIRKPVQTITKSQRNKRSLNGNIQVIMITWFKL